MKLYLTATSERGKEATKGGNEYIFINIRDHRQVSFGFVAVSIDPRNAYPTLRVFSHGAVLQVTGDEMQAIQNDINGDCAIDDTIEHLCIGVGCKK